LALRPFFRKRTILLCAFLVCGCTDSNQEPTIEREGSEPSANSDLIAKDQLSSQASPLLTLNELLNASDVKHALSSASANNDEVLLIEWQGMLLQAADEVNLKESEKSLIKGEQGLKYLAFQGMKSNYQVAFQRAFVAFDDVDEVYRAYPAFQDLHERSSRLVEQRDVLIESVADELKQQDFDGDAYKEAKRQWQVYIKSQPSLSP
jgi:hypothetical protein